MASIVTTGAFLFWARELGSSGLLGGFLLNLAASTATIGIGIIFVDYFLSEERRKSLLPLKRNALIEIEFVRLKLSSAIEVLFGGYKYDLRKLAEVTDIDNEDFVTPHLEKVEYLVANKKVLEPDFRLQKKDIEVYSQALDDSVIALDKVIAVGSSRILPTKQQERLLGLYATIRSAQSSVQAYKHITNIKIDDPKSKKTLDAMNQEIIKSTASLVLTSIKSRYQ